MGGQSEGAPPSFILQPHPLLFFPVQVVGKKTPGALRTTGSLGESPRSSQCLLLIIWEPVTPLGQAELKGNVPRKEAQHPVPVSDLWDSTSWLNKHCPFLYLPCSYAQHLVKGTAGRSLAWKALHLSPPLNPGNQEGISKERGWPAHIQTNPQISRN